MHTRHHTPRSGSLRSRSKSTLGILPDLAKRRSRLPSETWILVSIAIGVVCLAVSLIFLFADIKTAGWKTTVAVVVTSRTETYPIDDFTGTEIGRSISIEYSYEVNDKSYTGKGIYPPGAVAASALSARSKNRIWILHNPRKPEQSTLAATLSPELVLFLAIVGIVFLAGPLIYVLFRAIRNRDVNANREKGA